MKQLQIEDSKAKILYKTASLEFKQMLEDTFGKEFFSGKITDRIKTYEDACCKLNEIPIYRETFGNNRITDDELSYIKLKTITKALNEGWVPDWEDNRQQKWYPYFLLSSSSFVFDGLYCRYSHTAAGNSSRLCFPNEKLATYAGKQFVKIYKEFMF